MGSPSAAWVEEVADGAEKIIASGRITSEDSIRALRECVRLLRSEDPVDCQWDTALYEASPQLERRAFPTITEEDLDADVYDQSEESKHNQETGSENGQPNHMLNAVYLVRLEIPPFWGTKSLPFLIHDVWHTSVDFMVPSDRGEKSCRPLASKWVSFALPQDIHSSVACLSRYQSLAILGLTFESYDDTKIHHQCPWK